MDSPLTKDERTRQLGRLIESLAELVSILRLDAECQWTAHFERVLHEGRNLAKSFSQEQLSLYSSSVMFVYAGMGSFSDYAPSRYDPETGKFMQIAGTEMCEVLSASVYEGALELRVVGRR